ncbi:MAG TPA: LLM class flavin-dependent oxidoreductase [Longimicrobium sp.]|jgi:luciferase family oxidoreductase group 1|nr:LLM class flavin-dependent oxidoreductase [Longimicrobium sp.]
MALPLSVLDLAPVVSGGTAADAFRNMVELARLTERLGFTRYWLAEHHGMPSIASSAPEILIEHVASATERIRVGSGGIMLPNHAALRIAEAFHTLETLHPGRIDLGVGRAPGTDPVTSSALRPFDAEQFPQQLAELTALSRGEFPEGHPFHRVRVVPEGVALPPVWLLGSSGASARLAGQLGMGYAFASHFSPAPAGPPLQAYREAFQTSDAFPRPHAIVAASVVCAETEEEAERLATSMQLAWVRLQRGQFRPLPSPDEAAAYDYTPQDRAVVAGYRRLQLVGNPAQVRERLDALAEETGADEVMVTTVVYEHAARLRSYELLATSHGS